MNIIYNSETCCWEFQDRIWNAFEYNLKQVMRDILREKEENNTSPKQEEESYDSEDPRGWSNEEAIKRGYTTYEDLEGACHVKLMEEEGIPIPNTRNKLNAKAKPAPSISQEEALNKTDNLSEQTPTFSSQRKVKKRSSSTT